LNHFAIAPDRPISHQETDFACGRGGEPIRDTASSPVALLLRVEGV